jgi:hypothetical protein
MDALDDTARVERLREHCQGQGLEMFEISAVSGYGIDDFVVRVGARVELLRRASQVTAVSSS